MHIHTGSLSDLKIKTFRKLQDALFDGLDLSSFERAESFFFRCQGVYPSYGKRLYISNVQRRLSLTLLAKLML